MKHRKEMIIDRGPRNEAEFEKELFDSALNNGCYYHKIPDAKGINRFNRGSHREEKRPFDGVLVAPEWTLCIECKYNYGKLSDHQHANLERNNSINSYSSYVVRYRNGKYMIEYEGKLIHQSDNIDSMVRYLKG